MVDVTNTVHPQLAAHADAYFQRISDMASRPGIKVMAGVYLANDGASFTEQGQSRTPTHVVRVANHDGAVAGGHVTFADPSLATAVTRAQPLLVLDERADAVTDDAETLGRLLAPYGDEGRAWGTAIAGAPDRATRFNRRIADIDGVPTGAPSQDEVVLVAYLARHFTYDATGQYYAKWSGSGRNFPADVSDTYKQNALVERQLDRDNFYCLSVVTGEGAGGAFPAIEQLVRIVIPPGGGEAALELLYSASRRETEARAEFCFFYAAAGLNIAVPETARGTLSADVASLRLERSPQSILDEVRADATVTVSADGTKLKLSGIVRANATFSGATALPAGVERISEPPASAAAPSGADTSGDADDTLADGLQDLVETFLCPPDKVVELAANTDILVLQRVGRSQRGNLDVRTNVDLAGMLADLGNPADGAGGNVVIGVVDSGIDGSHPAFAGRIEKVWDQTVAVDPAHPHPAGTGNDFGQVFSTAADISSLSTDEMGHGTHVAGIAAGAASGAFTQAGMATNARIVAVKTDFDNDHIRRGVEWCFREAGDRPCVVNLSLGTPGSAHDGVDNFALAIRRTFRRPNSGGSGYYWVPGRVVVAAAGNAGASRGHGNVASIATNATADMPVVFDARTTGAGAAIPIAGERISLFARPLPATARGAHVEVRIRRGTGAAAAATKWFRFLPSGASDSDAIGTTTVTVFNGPPPPADQFGLVFTRHQHVEIIIFDTSPGGVPTGTWTVEIRNRTTSAIEVDGYIVRAFVAERFHPVFFAPSSERAMLHSPATAYGVVVVGATTNRTSWRPQGAPADGSGDQLAQQFPSNPATNQPLAATNAAVHDIADFTCPGPVRGTRRTIRAMAPGHAVLSALSASSIPSAQKVWTPGVDQIDALTVKMSGTSMATPVITGLVAGLLGRHPALTAKQVIDRLEASVTTPAGWDADRFGPGRIDASRIIS